jgi:hypothetical protein
MAFREQALRLILDLSSTVITLLVSLMITYLSCMWTIGYGWAKDIDNVFAFNSIQDAKQIDLQKDKIDVL